LFGIAASGVIDSYDLHSINFDHFIFKNLDIGFFEHISNRERPKVGLVIPSHVVDSLTSMKGFENGNSLVLVDMCPIKEISCDKNDVRFQLVKQRDNFINKKLSNQRSNMDIRKKDNLLFLPTFWKIFHSNISHLHDRTIGFIHTKDDSDQSQENGKNNEVHKVEIVPKSRSESKKHCHQDKDKKQIGKQSEPQRGQIVPNTHQDMVTEMR